MSIFCEIDDFCKELDRNMPQPLLTSPTKSRRGPPCCLSVSEIMTIQVLFHVGCIRKFISKGYGFLVVCSIRSLALCLRMV